jgi:hypothetical protein
MPPVVLIVVDDSEDDELVSIMATASNVPADDFGGGWASGLFSGVVRFKLERLSGGFEREWTLPGLNEDVVAASTQSHYVGLLPLEMAGDLSSFQVSDLNRLRGGMIVQAHATTALSALPR